MGIGDLENPDQTPEEKYEKIPDVYPWGKDWPPPPDPPVEKRWAAATKTVEIGQILLPKMDMDFEHQKTIIKVIWTPQTTRKSKLSVITELGGRDWLRLLEWLLDLAQSACTVQGPVSVRTSFRAILLDCVLALRTKLLDLCSALSPASAWTSNFQGTWTPFPNC